MFTITMPLNAALITATIFIGILSNICCAQFDLNECLKSKVSYYLVLSISSRNSFIGNTKLGQIPLIPFPLLLLYQNSEGGKRDDFDFTLGLAQTLRPFNRHKMESVFLL